MIEEASLWLGTPLPSRYAAGLAHRARRIFAHSAVFRRRMCAREDGGRERLYVFMRHSLAARLQSERPHLFARLPTGYRAGAPLPPASRPAHAASEPSPLSVECRLLLSV